MIDPTLRRRSIADLPAGHASPVQGEVPPKAAEGLRRRGCFAAFRRDGAPEGRSLRRSVGGSSLSCRERRFGVPHVPQAQNSLRLALLDTSLKEGGHFCTADSMRIPPANARRHWHAVAIGVRRARIHPCRPRGERGVVAVGWLVNRLANTVRPYPLAKKRQDARHAAAAERRDGAGLQWRPLPQVEAPTDAEAENVPYGASPLARAA